MGQPEYLNGKEVEELQQSSQLVKERQSWKYKERSVFLETNLPPHAIAAITIEFRQNKT
jgi:hypothetical protein